jgi:cation diffusion facilitator family transporter
MTGDDGLTPAQRQKEKVSLWAAVVDVSFLCIYTFVGLLSGSVTALSEIIRITLMLAISFVSYEVLRRTHRRRFNEFEYGTGKIERITNLLVAFGLLLSSSYILFKVLSMDAATPMSTNALALTLLASAINLAINYYFVMAYVRSNRDAPSLIIDTKITSRITKTIASAVVLFVFMVTVWLSDPLAARMVDKCGSILIVCYMAYIAYGLVRESLPEILDRTIPEPEHYQLLRILAEHFEDYDGFNGYKARRSGKDLFILLNLCFLPHRTMEEVKRRLAPLRRAIEKELPGSTVTIEPEIMKQV